jgi:hypothetical protein
MKEATKSVPCMLEKIKPTSADKAKFWAKVDIRGPNECWNWKQSKDRDGYGMSFVAGKRGRSHREAFRLSVSPIPKGLCVCHRCDNPSCCNPSHLFLGTVTDNNRDKGFKGRCNSPRGDNHYARTRPELVRRGERHHAKTKPGYAAKGEMNGTAKLSNEIVLGVRERFANGGVSRRQIAKEIGVSPSLIGQIINRQIWKHLP